jgi:hypothetical protein
MERSRRENCLSNTGSNRLMPPLTRKIMINIVGFKRDMWRYFDTPKGGN